MTKHLIAALTLVVSALVSVSAAAKENLWDCGYTSISYNSPMSMTEESRDCPEGMCNYLVRYDPDTQLAEVNGVQGYTVEAQSNTQLMFSRSAENVIVGGVDRSRLLLDVQSLAFVSEKSTSPQVTLTAHGVCTKVY